MKHLNGNIVCAIDTETTGLDPRFQEIIQLAIIPLDTGFDPIKEIIPFCIQMKPERPEFIDRAALRVNKSKVADLLQRGIDQETAKDLLQEWYDKLDLPCTKWGTRKKIIPLGHNYAHDRGFMRAWLGNEMYDDIFFGHYRDTMITAIYLNDRAGMHSQPVPYNKVALSWIAEKHKVPHRLKHDALSDALVTAGIYREMVRLGFLA